MSTRCRSVFERGRFFIETGTAKAFQLFYENGTGLVRYIPEFMVSRIVDLINRGEKDTAITLWMKLCMDADRAPVVIKAKLLHHTIHLVIGVMALYAFIRVIFL
jgi:hypothetical protein